MATLRDVARASGVSTATVSNVFNATGRVSDAVRTRVLERAADLGYAGPNPAAASLRRGSSGLLGVVLGEGLGYAFDDPAASAFIAGVADVGQESDLGLTLLPTRSRDESAKPGAGLAAIERAVVDGFLLYSIEEDHPGLAALLCRGVPLVPVDGPRGVQGPPWAGLVSVDDRCASYAAARHLLERGHRSAVVLLDRLGSTTSRGPVSWARARTAPSNVLRERVLGYTDAWSEAGLPEDSLVVLQCAYNTRAAAHSSTAPLLARPPDGRPTAVLATSDVLALGAVDAARDAGLGVPLDLSVIGFDDGPLAALHDPPLTTVRQPLREKGQVAARTLLAALAGAPAADALLPAELVVRDSTALAPQPPG